MQFDEGRNDHTSDFTLDAITKFVRANALPLVVDFNQESAQKIFGGEIKSHLLFFVGKGEEKYDSYKEAASNVAKDFKGQVNYYYFVFEYFSGFWF